eukprot:1146466-Pelagomonas_calceolata.AAC.9
MPLVLFCPWLPSHCAPSPDRFQIVNHTQPGRLPLTEHRAWNSCTQWLCTVPLACPSGCLQIVHRKRTNEVWEEYCGLMDKATSLLLAKTAEMGILRAPGQMPEGVG